ncbi:MAG: hypothetical protein C4520_06955 [Candidatus Abyssobacteria bacterium SURF_5]|uniref:Uncharacterized protein n=1 Tax=Abyssobacteria bacterium (strain SURF_5) TaxID=2093360 RepID=A0A3A4NR84_ABYX5|nr:MAG: hypothetical protein C4520_06955 [Candidatus Abyssubacteria bacterium SURF_5]
MFLFDNLKLNLIALTTPRPPIPETSFIILTKFRSACQRDSGAISGAFQAEIDVMISINNIEMLMRIYH